jgi:hypothetical protein
MEITLSLYVLNSVISIQDKNTLPPVSQMYAEKRAFSLEIAL